MSTHAASMAAGTVATPGTSQAVSTARPKRPELRALTGLRFFVAALVVFYHYGRSALTPYLPEALLNVLANGYVGVSFFFLLSGYILAYNYIETGPGDTDEVRLRGSRREFWWNRFSRVYPLYVLAWLLYLPIIVEIRLGNGTTVTAIAQLVAAGGATLALIQTWIPGGTTWWNPPGWSIAVEAIFYASFPFILPTVAGWGRTAKRGGVILLGLWIAALVGPALYLATGRSPLALNIVKFNPLLHLPEFTFGMLVAVMHRKPNVQAWACKWRHLLIAAGALSAIAVLMSPEGPPLYPLIHNGLLLPSFGLCIVGLAELKTAGPMGSRPLIALGKASYGLYILQAPLQLYWAKTGWLANHPALGFLVYLAGLCVASMVAHALVEQPLQKTLRQWYKKSEERT